MHTVIDTSSVRSLPHRHAKTFLTTFACILVAVACSLGLVYSAFQTIALDSIARQYRDFVGQLDSLSNMLSSTIRNYGMQIFYAPAVLALRENAALDKLSQVYALRELGSYISSNDFVDSIQVYNRASGSIYSTDSNVISAPIGVYADREAAALFQSLTSELRMRPIRRTAFSEDPVRARAYFSFLFFETTAEDEPAGGALMLNVDYDRYLDTLLSFDQRGNCVLLDEKGGLLTAGWEELKPLIPLFFDEICKDGREDSGYFLKNVAGEETVCLHFRLPSSRWYYLKITSLNECVPRLLELKNALIVVIVVGFALLASCTLGVLLFLYLPVYQVRTALRSIGLEKSGELAGQVSQLAQQSEAHRRAGALQALLEKQDASLLPELPRPYILVLMETECSTPVLRQTHPELPALTYRQDGCDVILFFGKERSAVLQICRDLSGLPGVYCFCGSARDTLPQIAECYHVLCEMRRQKFWTREQHCDLEEEFAARHPHSSFTEQMISDLISALRGNDLAQSQRLWRHIQETIRGDRFQDQIFAFRRLASRLEKQFPASKPLVSDDFWVELTDARVLDSRFSDAFCKIIQSNQALHKKHIDRLAGQVVQRIECSYMDSDLSPTRIADEFKMSSAYLGRIFRESMQISISQYINQIRIHHAGELLTKTGQPVETIAETVGFSNPKYFYVVFKHLIGQTPIQFRKTHRSAANVGETPDLTSDRREGEQANRHGE